ncbi:MAG: hypothetical protein Q7J85_13640 [Bacillota bacterium]|nr:hypothetical protein [Bacillota bacterium]
MLKDRLLLGGFAGIIAALLANLTLYFMNIFIPGQNINMPEVTTEIFLNVSSYTLTHQVLGVIWSTVVGSVYAIFYLITLDLTGWNNLWLKSMMVITGLWLMGAGFIMKLLELAQGVRDYPLSILAFFIAHLFFATYLYFFVKKYGIEKA